MTQCNGKGGSSSGRASVEVTNILCEEVNPPKVGGSSPPHPFLGG